MGMFDTIHTGDRCGQTKALGQNIRDVVPGDAVGLSPDDDFWSMDQVDTFIPVSFQLAMHEGGFVVVCEGVLTAWEDLPRPGLLLVDNYGEVCTSLPRRPDRQEEDVALLAQMDRRASRCPQTPPERQTTLERSARMDRGLPLSCPVCTRLQATSTEV